MQNFFTTSDGQEIEPTRSFENTGIQKLIPEGTQLLANVLEAKWAESTSFKNQHIVINWMIVEKGEYNGFIIKHSLEVCADDTKKQDKAKTMLMTIDTLCKGKLAKLAKAGKFELGNSVQLADAIVGGSAVITLREYEMKRDDGSTMTGNWVGKVQEPPAKIRREDAAIERKAAEQPNAPESDGFDDPFDDYDDGIVF